MLMGTGMAVYVGRHGSPFAVSMVQVMFFLGMMLFAPVWGAVADVAGCRRTILIITGAMATLAIIPLLFIKNVWIQIGVRGLYSVFAAGFAPIMLTILSSDQSAAERGQSVGFFNSARGAGYAGGQFCVGALLGLLAPSGLFLVIGITSFMATIGVLLGVEPTSASEQEVALGTLLHEMKDRLTPQIGTSDYLQSHGLQWLYVALAIRNMTVLGVLALLPPYLLGSIGVSELVMGILLAINPGGQTVFMYLFGHLSESAGRKQLIVIGMIGSAIFSVLCGLATIPDTILVRGAVVGLGLFCLAVSFSAMTVGALAFIGDVAPSGHESELLGLRSTAKGVGGVIGPTVLGVTATVTSYETAFLLASILAVIATVVAVVMLTESRPDAHSNWAILNWLPIDR